MFFSKTFGYALRGLLYLAQAGSNRKVQLEEIALKLKIPRHFLAKVMKKLAKGAIIDSYRGPSGGFLVTETTLQTTLLTIANLTGEPVQADSCVLRFRKCNTAQPCPLHAGALEIRNQWLHLLSSTTIHDLLHKENPNLVQQVTAGVSITTA